MGAPIIIEDRGDGFQITVAGVGGGMAFASFLVQAKFSNPINIERLISPILNAMLNSCAPLVSKAGVSLAEECQRRVKPEMRKEIEIEIARYAESLGLDAEAAKKVSEEAFYPIVF